MMRASEVPSEADHKLLQLVRVLETGSRDEKEAAATRIFDLCAGRVRSAIKRRLNGRLRRRFDADDVVNATFWFLFRRIDRGKYRFDRVSKFWRMLFRIARHEFLTLVAYHKAQMRDVRREVEAEVPQFIREDRIDRDHNTEVAKLWSERVEAFLEGINPVHADWFRLRYLANWTWKRIALQYHCSRKKVASIVRDLVERLRRELDGGLDAAA